MRHWGIKQRMAEEWHLLVFQCCKEQKVAPINKIGRLIEVTIKCYFKSRAKALDPDNICAKIAIDGLKGIVIKDDNLDHIKRVSTESYVDRDNPRTEIIISFI